MSSRRGRMSKAHLRPPSPPAPENRPGRGPSMAPAVSPDGTRLYVTGSVTDYPRHVYGTIAYDAHTGATLWVQTFAGPLKIDTVEELVVSPDGARVFVSGTGKVPNHSYDIETEASDAQTGAEMWV